MTRAIPFKNMGNCGEMGSYNYTSEGKVNPPMKNEIILSSASG